MRERILSSVDFPAPLRPMTPALRRSAAQVQGADDLALLHLEGDVLERPEESSSLVISFQFRVVCGQTWLTTDN